MSDRDREAQLLLLKRAMVGGGLDNSSAGPPAVTTATAADQDGGSSKKQGRSSQQEAQAMRESGDGSSRSTVVLVTTDVCLKASPKELLPLGVPLLVQFDLARQKEAFQRRVSALCGSGKERRSAAWPSIIIDFVSAGEVAAFRTSETWTAGLVREMPVQVAEIFQPTA